MYDLLISQRVAGEAAAPCSGERPFAPGKSGWTGRFAAGSSRCVGQPGRSANHLQGIVNAITLGITNAAGDAMSAKMQGETIGAL